MHIPLEHFDISVYDSTVISLKTPEWLMTKTSTVLEALIESSADGIPEENMEIKLRAVLNGLVHEGLKQNAWSKAQLEEAVSFSIPKLSEIAVERKPMFDLVRYHNQLVVLIPKLNETSGIAELIDSLNMLIDQSRGARTWLLDLSLVTKVPFELFGYLIGLKHTLTRTQIGLDLLWLRKDAVPAELTEAVQKNFNLHKKGSFLLSR